MVLDVGPLLTLKTRLSRAALCSGITLYTEGIVTLVLVSDAIVTPAVVPLVAASMAAQAIVLRHPAEQLLEKRLTSSYKKHLGLAVAVMLVLVAGARGDDARGASLILGAMAIAFSWPVVGAMRAARQVRDRLPESADRHALRSCLAFDPRLAVTVRMRALGGRRRWVRPFAVATGIFVVTLAGLTLLFQAMGVRPPGSIGSVAALAALWAFYRTLRHVKPRASDLRAHDPRPPVLVLRQFTDDTLAFGRLPGGTFEHVIVTDLSRVGPTVSIGRPGERLQPLGAAREYLDGADWKTAVATLLGETGLVVLILGGSESLTWEFTTAIGICGTARVFVIVPPISRDQIERRWQSFAAATADVLPQPLPAALPTGQVLGVMFAGGQPVFIVNGAAAGKRSGKSRGWPEHRLVLRLRECLGHGELASVRALTQYLERMLPVLRTPNHGLPAHA